MGFIDNVARAVRAIFANDKEHAPAKMAAGKPPAHAVPGSLDYLSAYGSSALSEGLRVENDLLARFVDVENMDDYPLCNAALDVYADDATQADIDTGRTVWVESLDPEVTRVLDEELLRHTLRFDEEVWEIARSLCKYGNNSEELLVTKDGVVGLNHLPAATLRRIETSKGELKGFIQDERGRTGFSVQDLEYLLAVRDGRAEPSRDANDKLSTAVAFEDWEVVHFRLRGKQRRSAYGWSVLDGARWIWKRLVTLEDSALIYRLQRAPERFAFYIDVGNMPAPQAMAYLNQIRQQYKKQRFIQPGTNMQDVRYNNLGQDDDFFVPTRGGNKSTEIDVLGSPSWQHMEDIEYFLKHLHAAIKIPKAYLSQEEGVARAVLSSQDVRFARTVLRIQRELRTGTNKMCRVHLAALGIDPDAVEYDVRMQVPSAIFELAQLEVKNARADYAGRMKDFVSLYWILQTVFGFRDDEIKTIIAQKEEDARREAAAAGGGGGFGGGGFESRSRRKGYLLTEKELLERKGDKDAEKRLLDKLAKSGKVVLTPQMTEMRKLIHELIQSQQPVSRIGEPD